MIPIRPVLGLMAILLVAAAVGVPRASAAVDFRVRVRADVADPAAAFARVSAEVGQELQPAASPSLRATIARRVGIARRGELLAGPLSRLARWSRLSVPDRDAEEVRARLLRHPDVEAIEDVLVAETCAFVPDDPLLVNQLRWTAQPRLTEAWAGAAEGDFAPVLVAIVDGGTDWMHPDLLANIALNELEVDGDGIDQDGNGFVDDLRGWNFPAQGPDPVPLASQDFNARHGTHVAGIVGAELGNGIGIAGAGGNPRLLPINAAHPTIDGAIGYGYEGILYAVGRGARIINCSWRTARSVGGRLSDAPYSAFEALVLEVVRQAGALVVAAVGNDFAEDVWTTPAGYPGVLSVTATLGDSEDLWPAANLADWMDLAAPGFGVVSTFPLAQSGVIGAYGLLSGTSMATAVVSGIGALLMREHPDWTGRELRSRLRWTATEHPVLSGLRIVRADAALLDSTRGDVALAITGATDADGDGLAEGDERFDLQFTVEAVFEGQVGVTVETWSDDPWVVALVDRTVFPAVPAGAPLTVTRGLGYWVRPGAPAGHLASIQLRAQVDGVAGPAESGVVELRPLSATIEAGELVVTASANGVLGQPGQLASRLPYRSALERRDEGVGFLTRGALMLGRAGPHVSDALLPRTPERSQKDFFPQGSGVARRETAAGVPEIELAYSDLGALDPLGVRVRQTVRAFPHEGAAGFALVEYEFRSVETVVEDLRWGLALDWAVPALDPLTDGSFSSERLVVLPGGRGMRVEAADEGSGTGVAGVLVLGASADLGFSGLAEWHSPSEPGWNFIAFASRTVSDSVLWERMRPGIDDTTLDPVGGRVGIVSGALGPVSPDAVGEVAIALAIAPDAASLEDALEMARITWESGRIGETPSTLSTGLLAPSANPFADESEMRFAMERPGGVRLQVFDLRGRLVRTLVDGGRPAGVHRIVWDGRDARGRAVSSGVYFVRLSVGGETSARPVTVVR